MVDWTNFLNEPKGLLIAPAGHGKTYAIAECVNQLPEGTCQLILTHTHAGIASIRYKMKKQKVLPSKYHIETITGFAQRFTLAFSNKSDFPPQEDKTFFNALVKRANLLFELASIKNVIRNSYYSLFVDEYQDCTLDQHQLIMLLSSVLPTHILGDELQGIFDFNSSPVCFNRDLTEFTKFNKLTTPWRWCQPGNCVALGDKLLAYRTILESNNKVITLTTDRNAHVGVYRHESLIPNSKSIEDKIQDRARAQKARTDYSKMLHDVINRSLTKSILIVVPSIFKWDINGRVNLKSSFDYDNSFTLLEAIDAKEFYSCAKGVDDLIAKLLDPSFENKIDGIKEILLTFSFKKGDLEKWFGVNKIKNKRDKREKEISLSLSGKIELLIEDASYATFLDVLSFFYRGFRYKGKRPELLHSIYSCLKNTVGNEETAYQSMKNLKNQIRRSGRKIEGKCIGTTLLTKGLEFDTVIVLDAHLFKKKCDFYVAISRACNNLIFFTENTELKFE